MYVWDAEEPEPQKLYSCSVRSTNDDIVWHRQALLRLSKSENLPNSVTDSFSLDFLSEALIGDACQKKIQTFYIVQTMASTSSRIGFFAAKASKEYDIHLLPWASVAACTSNDSLDDEPLKLGHAFCFLPLPVRTGLAVQVNAYFEVASNRRGIWFGADMDRSGKIRSVWNRLLLEDVVAPTFVQLLCGVQGLLGSTKIYYSLWPRGSFEEPWNILVEHIYRHIFNAPVLYSDAGGGNWVSPMDAFLHDEEFTRSKELGEALLQLGMPIVQLPKILYDMLLSNALTYQLKVVTPDLVRVFLRDCKILASLRRSLKIVLLEYCLEDLIDVDVGAHAYNLPLLPLASGDFGSLSEASKGKSYFICSELECLLLERIADTIIDRNIPLYILTRLTSIAKCSKANLIVFDVYYLLQLFHGFVPADWKHRNKVIWDPESGCSHPTSAWFVLLWQYLQNQTEDLSIFGDWPILPSTSGHLYRISRQSKLINAGKLSDKLQDLLAKIGCKILDCKYGIDHPDLSTYVCDGDGDVAGVLESIFNVISSNHVSMQTVFQNLGLEEKDGLRGFLLEPKWYIGNNMHDSSIRNCRMLPIYRVFDPENTQGFRFSDLENPLKYLPPLNVPKCLLSGEFISCSSVEEEIFLRYFGIMRMRKAFFYKQHVFNRVRVIQPEVRDSTMLSILQDLPQLCADDASFREVMRNLEFIPTLRGSLKCPAVLYDPRNEELYALLSDSDSFPSGVFLESGILDMLQGLGLRTSVSLETVIQIAQWVEHLMHEDQQKAYLRGKVLLSYLEVNAMRWLPDPLTDDQGAVIRLFSRATSALRTHSIKSDLEKFWNDLRMICWCPVLVSTPYETLPWPSVSSMVAPPKLVRLRRDLWLVSASMRILDGECSSTAMAHQLGWSSLPGGSVIASQLLELGKNNEIVIDQVLRQELALAMPRIYSILMGMIGSDEMDIVKTVLEGCRWIWVGDGFATSEEVVLKGPLHMSPYVRVIPVDLAAFKDLFLELGIREFLSPVDHANILCRMFARKGAIPLDPQEISAAIMILQHLAEVQFDDQQARIYVPDVTGRLFPAGDLVYNDAPWLLGLEVPASSFSNTCTMTLNERELVQKFVHGNISNDVAEKLGVCSLRRTLLAESADSMNLSLSGTAEAFGQHEALTTRLKHILEMYADGPGVLFELVQNAEDAGASEVIFLLDKTQYGTSSILSPEMADWQGPALYCFNDSIFSSQDFYAISRIGQESKLDKPFSIGRFGLGFNCVYHFTDIPMFVSGDNIVIFDPHACNLPGISSSHPGLRIRYVGKRVLEQFPDQFSSFLHFGCDMQQSFPGTLFRFPLRSASVAHRSQIKKEGYEPEDVISLFSSFTEVVSEALLFLRNVKTISVFIKEGAGHDMQLLHRVHKNCVGETEVEPKARQHMFDFIHENQMGGMDKDRLLNKLNQSIARDLPWKCQKIVMIEKSTYATVSHLWITCECLGGGQLKSNLAASKKSHNSIPWACVAVYIHPIDLERGSSETLNVTESLGITPDIFKVRLDSIGDRKGFEGRAFCFLPLPISTGLPAHVNAYFELSSNRRDIWFGSDMAGGGKKRSDWNIYLLEDVVAPAFGHLLEKLASEIGPCDLFFSFWPKKIGSEPWASMVRKLYIFISDFGLRILHTSARGGQWISSKQAIFPDFTFHRADELMDVLSDAGLPLVTVPKEIVDRFMDVCPSLHFLMPQLLRSLLIRRKRGFRERNAVILTLEYCLLDLEIPVQCESLYGLCLIPLANGLYTSFTKMGLGERVYIAQGEEYGLLKDSVPNQLVDFEIPVGVHEKLCDMARTKVSNISLLTCELLEKLFQKLLPIEWQHSKQVSWTPGHEGQPSFEWIKLLWSYLNSCCDDLSIFSNWPILPVGNSKLLQLVENSNVIKDDGWSENLSSLLVKAGCCFLMPEIPIEHPQSKNYVHSPTAVGVLNALLAVASWPENIEDLFVDASEGELHELRSFVLQTKWYVEDLLKDRHINLIKHLPVFESFKSRKLVSLSRPKKWLMPDGVSENLIDDSFIRTESERERNILLRFLGIKEPPKAEFFKNHVLNRMSEFVSKKGALSAIIHDLKLLIEEDSSVKTALSSTPFVLAANGSWQQPSRLYDPRVPGLQNVLHREVFFPSKEFSDPEILNTLAITGLRQSLGYTGMLDCARSVSLLHDFRDLEAPVYGKRLLVCLDALAMSLSAEKGEHNIMLYQNGDVSSSGGESVDLLNQCRLRKDLDIDLFVEKLIHDKPEEEFWSEMTSIAWCPICTDPPLNGLPWLISSNLVAPPSTVRPISQMWMVSSTMHMLEGEFCSLYLQQKLGWVDTPNIDDLTTQLIELCKSYRQLKSCSMVESKFDAALQSGIPSLYSKLQEYIGTDEFMKLESALEGVPWVWIGDDFVSPNALAFDSPVNFSPYLYVVQSELSEFRDLLLALGVKLSFDIRDYVNVLQRLHSDVNGLALSTDELSFVHCVLEAVADLYQGGVSNISLFIPDSFGVLKPAGDLLYNDAPWMENISLVGKSFVHQSIGNDLANRLCLQSLRRISVMDDEMTKNLPCMDYAKINELLASYGGSRFLPFDLLELADCCKAKKLHLIFDKRQHPCQSLLQHNLGEFQGPALVGILEGATLSRDEVCSLQLLPPWRLRGDTLNYGLGLLCCYSICDVPAIVSDGCFYMFDPSGMALSDSSNCVPAARMFSLTGTNLTERFRDQFNPMLLNPKMPWSSSDSTVIRMPLSSGCMKNGLDDGSKIIQQIFDGFTEHASGSLLFLKSVLQVSLSTWEEENEQPCEVCTVFVDPSSAIRRNPFSEKKWRKFRISRIFGSSNAAIKSHILDVNLNQGGVGFVDKWLVVLSLGSGQTRNMALDRRYLAYNLIPIAGVAALISRNGHPAKVNLLATISSPLPLSSCVNLPITVVGCFLTRHNDGRYLFKYQDKNSLEDAHPDTGNQLMEAWNRELMSCVCDSYAELILEIHKSKRESLSSSNASVERHAVWLALRASGNDFYSFWPKSNGHGINHQDDTAGQFRPAGAYQADWECITEQVVKPFYARLVNLPVWQLYSGNIVKADEGMFLSHPGNGVGGNLLPATVCAFVKEHYPVFSVPWELVTEVQALGVAVREIKPKMVRDLLRVSSASIVLRSIDTYVDVLEYCLSDIQLKDSFSLGGDDTSIYNGLPNHINDGYMERGSTSASVSIPSLQRFHGISGRSQDSSGGDALEIMTTLGKALFDFGKGVVEDIGRAGGPTVDGSTTGARTGDKTTGSEDQRLLAIAAELKGLPVPTGANHLTRLGVKELWVGNEKLQSLMNPLAAQFIHFKILNRSILSDIFLNSLLQSLLNLKSFSLKLLAQHMHSIFDYSWVNHVKDSNMAPWFSWDNTTVSGGVGGPSPEWIRLFWKSFTGSAEDLSLFSDWPLIPAFLGRPVLCRVKERHLVFIPPPVIDLSIHVLEENAYESESIQPYISAFQEVEHRYPWLLSLLNQFNIPIFDAAFMDAAPSCNCFPEPSHSLGQTIASKLVTAKHAGYFPDLTSISAPDCDELFAFFSSDFSSNGSAYRREELDVLCSLPIYKTVVGTYTRLQTNDHCMISPNSFFKPYDEHCLCYSVNSAESLLVKALGVPELLDKHILVRFGLPGFESKPQSEQEDILIYLYRNWQDLNVDSSVIDTLKNTKFVKNADEFSTDLSKPGELFDPGDALLASVFSGERKKFPGERYTTDGWLRILKKAGLRTASEADVVLDCARRVEFLGGECLKSLGGLDDFEKELSSSQNEVSLEIWSLAGSVIESIYSNFAILYSNNFCNALGKITCIPAEKGFPGIGGMKVLSSYSDAVLLRDWPLAWSCAPIISRQNVVPPEFSWGPLHLRSPPLFATVLKHLKVIGQNGGEDTLAHWPTLSGIMTIDKASCEVLEYLDRVWDSLSASDMDELRRVAFIPAANGTRLVTVDSLFVRLPINLSPFAFELPSLYLPFVKILKDLGLQDMLSVSAAKNLLLNLQKFCGYQHLNPNEFRAVMELLHFVCNENALDGSDWALDAIVPDDGCRLVHAKSCVYVDSYGSRYVNSIDNSRLRFVHPEVPERICAALGVKKLSDVVVEELYPDEQLQTLEFVGSVPLASIRRKLLSRSLQSAVWTVVSSLVGNVPAFDKPALEKIQYLLEFVADKLQFVQTIYTRFLLLPKSLDITRVAKESMIPEWDDESRHRTLFFVRHKMSCILIAEPPTYISIIDVIAIVVSQVLGSPIPLPIGSLFLCPEDSEAAVADTLTLCMDKRSGKSAGGYNCSVGKDVLPQDALQVQIHPLRPFYTGEVVAWRSKKGEKLKYGRVPEDVRPSAGQALYRFKVEVAPGVTEHLLSSQVFSFRSVAMGNEPTTSIRMEGFLLFTKDQTDVEVGECSGTREVKSAELEHGKDVRQYEHVSPAELVQAVHEMLSVAGINLDVEKQSLLQTTLTLQEQLKESQAAFLLEQEKADLATKEADTAKAAWLCRVCLTSEIDISIVPCGHVLCRRCSSAVSKCPFCRLQVSKIMKIYRP